MSKLPMTTRKGRVHLKKYITVKTAFQQEFFETMSASQTLPGALPLRSRPRISCGGAPPPKRDFFSP